ncbi:MAG TPA: hypothetical protein VF713_14150 [Thermoanaerobaculia bacterium]
MSALDDVLAAVAAAMHENAARWYLFGAQAATLWGRPRLTADVDITAEIPFERIDSFLDAMKRRGFSLRFNDREFVNQVSVVLDKRYVSVGGLALAIVTPWK